MNRLLALAQNLRKMTPDERERMEREIRAGQPPNPRADGTPKPRKIPKAPEDRDH